MASALFGLFGRTVAGGSAAPPAPTVVDAASPARAAAAGPACGGEQRTEHQARKRPLLPAGVPDAAHGADDSDRGGGDSGGAPCGSEHGTDAAVGAPVESSGGDGGAPSEAAPYGAACSSEAENTSETSHGRDRPKIKRTAAAKAARNKKSKAHKQTKAAAAPDAAPDVVPGTESIAAELAAEKRRTAQLEPTDGRAVLPTSFRKSRSRATSAGAQDGRPQSSRAHARTTQDPFCAWHGSLLPAGHGPDRSRTPRPSISSTLTVGDDILADGVSLLNVGSGRARTY